MTKKIYTVEGMHCASCAQIIQKSVGKVSGVDHIEVNLATHQALVDFAHESLPLDQLNAALKGFDYRLVEQESSSSSTESGKHDPTHHSTEISAGQVSILATMIVIVFVMMGYDIGVRYNFWNEISWLSQTFHALMPLFATYALFGITTRYLKASWQFVRTGRGNMDSLIGIGSIVAFVYSLMVSIFSEQLALYTDVSRNFYEAVVVVIGFSLMGRYIEHQQLSRNETAITSLMNLQAKHALVLKDGKEILLALEQVQPGDRLIVKAGESIPLDGVIIQGSSDVDEQMLTWESLPVLKQVGDQVIGGTININGLLIVQTTKVGADTVLSHIIQMVSQAQNFKPKIQQLADKIAAIFVPSVIILAILTLIARIVIGKSIGLEGYRVRGIIAFVAILVIACPCALGLATPLGVVNGITRASRQGILVRNTDGLLALKDSTTIVFDKTGTLTTGKPQLVLDQDLDAQGKAYLQVVASLEQGSTHPLAHAIVSATQDHQLELLPVQDSVTLAGLGLQGVIDDQQYYAWNKTFVETILGSEALTSSSWDVRLKTILDSYQTPVFLFDDTTILALYGLSDTIKPGVTDTLQELHDQGITTMMVTGDHQAVADHIAQKLGIDQVIAQANPSQKAQVLQDLRNQQEGKIVMVGDGINDSVALSLADVSISMSQGSDVSIASSDLVLLKGDLTKIGQALRISRSTNQLIRQNLAWAFSYNLIGIPLAWGRLYARLGRQLNPIFSGIIMAASSLIVVLNSMRGMRR